MRPHQGLAAMSSGCIVWQENGSVLSGLETRADGKSFLQFHIIAPLNVFQIFFRIIIICNINN